MQIAQIGMNTSDIPASLRLYSEAFGFRNAGGQGLWGETIRVHGLSSEATALMWWMIGEQKFFQLEFFHHSNPGQRPLPADWRPCDCGWVRLSIAVPDLNRSIRVLETRGVRLLGSEDGPSGRRIAFRDPQVGTIVEVVEEKDRAGPAFRSATSSVSDLDTALVHYRDTLGLPIRPLEDLRRPEDEALWGLAGAKRQGFAVTIGDRSLEIVQYEDPIGRKRPEDFRTSDQGIMNVAIISRSTEEIEAMFSRLAKAGYTSPAMMRSEGIVAGYIIDAERELELAAIPEEMDRFVGFEYTQPFFT
jgi:catechol 2,3-dioxygenase-like lactoylglutathione lyase family enzyme